MKGKSQPTGFTLVELVVVIAVITLLAGILIPIVTSQSDDAKRTRASADMDVVAKAFSTFRTHTNVWPAAGNPVPVASMTTANNDMSEYPCLYANATNLPGWKGPYLNQGAMVNNVMQVAVSATANASGKGLLDPWGQPYRIFAFAPAGGNGGAIMVVSRGPDGVVNSSSNDVNAGVPAGDDMIKVISRRL